MLTTIHVTTSLPTHIPKGSYHKPPDGRQPKDSPRSVHLEEIHSENHPSIHLLDLLDD